jgi:hypothetical protein
LHRVISRFDYLLFLMHASPAFIGHLKLGELNCIQSCLERLTRGFTTVKYNIGKLFDLADYNFFKSISDNAEHCIYN